MKLFVKVIIWFCVNAITFSRYKYSIQWIWKIDWCREIRENHQKGRIRERIFILFVYVYISVTSIVSHTCDISFRVFWQNLQIILRVSWLLLRYLMVLILCLIWYYWIYETAWNVKFTIWNLHYIEVNPSFTSHQCPIITNFQLITSY